MQLVCILFFLMMTRFRCLNAELIGIPCQSPYAHLCDDGSCIHVTQVCNGIVDCPDGSDEKDLNGTYDEMTWMLCTRKWNRKDVKCLLPGRYVCDTFAHCLEDECGCGRTFHCSDTECVSSLDFCNGYVDCTNGADEMAYSSHKEGSTECYGHFQPQSCAISPINMCDGIHHCMHSEDECFCDSDNSTGVTNSQSIFSEYCFRCLDGNGVIDLTFMCDGYYRCSDMSDECLCEYPRSTCDQLEYEGICEFRCVSDLSHGNATDCIKKTQICDGNRDCSMGEDEKYCTGAAFTNIISMSYYKNKNMPEFWCCNAGYPADCLYHYTYTNATHDACAQFFECPPGFGNKLKYAVKCDGVVSCAGAADECNDDCKVDGILPEYCSNNSGGFLFFTCPDSTMTYAMREMCNGRPACSPEAIHESYDEKDCPERYYCTNGKYEGGPLYVSVGETEICDCIENCLDGSDEANCSSYKYFCCRNGMETVPHEMVCDGFPDCHDESDECQSCVVSPFADDGHIIKSKPLQAFVWITGTTSLAGNIFLIIDRVKNLRSSQSSILRTSNSIQLIGLAIADLTVGIYLLSLGIVNSVYAGKYCFVDYTWRSGNTCHALGVISTFGIETSVFMLTTITAIRLFTVLRPFSSPPGIRRTIFFVTIVYFISLTLALVPISSLAKDYFVEKVRLTNNPFFRRTMDRKDFSDFANKVASYGNEKWNFSATLGNKNDLYSWEVMYKLMRQLNDSIVPEFEFGFYSTHGVCLPKFFPGVVDSSWHYSLLLVLVNFVSFIFISVSYMIIFKRRQQSGSNAGQNTDLTSLQRKITRIIVTDFMCWMPICLVAFLKFAGVPVSEDIYEIAAIVILPINSALNPFLYSNLPDLIWTSVMKIYRRLRRGKKGTNSGIASTTSPTRGHEGTPE